MLFLPYLSSGSDALSQLQILMICDLLPSDGAVLVNVVSGHLCQISDLLGSITVDFFLIVVVLDTPVPISASPEMSVISNVK